MTETEIPLRCKICKFILQDKNLIEDLGVPFGCGWNEGLNPISEGCDEFRIGKWSLLEYLQELEKLINHE